MRAGYDRVYSDTIRPPIPDLPVDSQSRTPQEYGSRTGMVIETVFALVLTIFGGVMLLLATT